MNWSVGVVLLDLHEMLDFYSVHKEHNHRKYGATNFDLWGLSFIQNMYRSKVPSKFVLQLIKAGGPNLIPPSYNKIIFERFNDFIAELHNLT